MALVILGFRLASFLLGVPGVTVLVLYGLHRLDRWLHPPTPPGAATPNPDAVVMVLEGSVRVLSWLAGAFGRVGEMVYHLLAMLAVAAVGLAAGLHFVARGLQAHQPWARWTALVLVGGLLLVSLLSLTVLRGVPMVLALAWTITCAAGLWILWRGFGLA